jgi:hypothetical protein
MSDVEVPEGMLSAVSCDSVRAVATEWIRRMYDAPEPEVPEPVKEILMKRGLIDWNSSECAIAVEAYRRGQQSKL